MFKLARLNIYLGPIFCLLTAGWIFIGVSGDVIDEGVTRSVSQRSVEGFTGRPE